MARLRKCQWQGMMRVGRQAIPSSKTIPYSSLHTHVQECRKDSSNPSQKKAPLSQFTSKMLKHSGLSQSEMGYIMVSVAAYRVYHHSPSDIDAHYAGYLWHDYDKEGFICLMKDLDQTTTQPSILPPPPIRCISVHHDQLCLHRNPTMLLQQ